jgi:cytochrome c1
MKAVVAYLDRCHRPGQKHRKRQRGKRCGNHFE